MPITQCTPAVLGSAVPPVTASFRNDCDERVAVEGVQAEVYDKFNTLITTITFGTFSPAASADTWSTSIVEVETSTGFHYEILNLPIVDTDVIPGGLVSVKWTMQDAGGSLPVVWELYTFAPPAGIPKLKTILSWYPVEGAVGYRVYSSVGDNDAENVGATTIPAFTIESPSSQSTSFEVVGTTGGTWELSISTANGGFSTQLVDADNDPDVVLLQDSDDVFWTLEIDSGTGNPSLTLTGATTDSATVVKISGPGEIIWQAGASTVGALTSTIATYQTTLGRRGVQYTVVALGPGYNAAAGTFDVLKEYIAKEVLQTTTEKDVCIVTGSVLNVSGVGVNVHRILFSVYYCDSDQVVQNSVLHAGTEVDVVVNDYGYFAVPLLQGALVLCEIPSANYAQRFTVPSQPHIDISQINGLPVELRRGE